MRLSRRLMNVAPALLAWLAACAESGAQPKDTPARAPGQGVKSARRPIPARVVSLQELTDSASRIFQGTIAKIEPKEVELVGSGGKKVKAKAIEVTFDVTQGLKGDVAVGKPLVVLMSPSANLPLERGEEVLWYLDRPKAGAGQAGFVAPIGLRSGYFRIKPDPEQPEAKVATNLLDNAGLWSSSAPLVGSAKGLSRKQLADSLQKRGNVTDTRSKRILTQASRPNRPGPLPLELITSVTENLLTSEP